MNGTTGHRVRGSVPSSGQVCPVERAGVSRRPGRSVLSTGQVCPVDRAGVSPRVGGSVPSTGRVCPVDWAVMAPRVAVLVAELDEPRTEGRRPVRAPDPDEVQLSHEHEPWRPETSQQELTG
jgi:hypothetical protein